MTTVAQLIPSHSAPDPTPYNGTNHIQGRSSNLSQPNLETHSQKFPEACFSSYYKTIQVDDND